MVYEFRRWLTARFSYVLPSGPKTVHLLGVRKRKTRTTPEPRLHREVWGTHCLTVKIEKNKQNVTFITETSAEVSLRGGEGELGVPGERIDVRRKIGWAGAK